MPKRSDINKILIIGAGPIIISQACEFDYSGTQACKALSLDGFETILINSNPATIMTDPETAAKTYIEPITPDIVEMIIEKERPDALLPTLGGQTGLNTAVEVAERGVLDKFGVEMLGASLKSIKKAEDRQLFRDCMKKIGLEVPKSFIIEELSDIVYALEGLEFPIIVRPSYTLGGTGGGIAYNIEELANMAKAGLEASLIRQVMLEESVLGWKEYELEVMRDKNGNTVIVCSIENMDPMGVHTGDSITVAPAQTLSDKEYQKMRDATIAVMGEIEVDTGGSNVQFAVNPKNGRMVIIEMNPRVSRSSALASKAVGFPIAKIAAKLAVGYTLDEIQNDITGRTFAAFEPAIDYCVVKIPRWTFEKFPESKDILTTSMQSVGETMAFGRTFKEALQKGLRSLDIGADGLLGYNNYNEDIEKKIAIPNSCRLFYIAKALSNGMSLEKIHKLSNIDTWFIIQLKQLIEAEQRLKTRFKPENDLKPAKQMGFSDSKIAELTGIDPYDLRDLRKSMGITPVYKLVDTCSAEFEASTPYYYSSYEEENEARISQKRKIMILGGGPNRIGQGIEFDCCCVHASQALRQEGIQSIMVNSNPESVSTDYDISDRLYFEPLTVEDVLNIVDIEQPDGVIVQFGGQTPLNLCGPLYKHGVKILGTSPESIDRAEDRELFKAMLQKLGLRQPENKIVTDLDRALHAAEKIGYPVIVRPSYVLGGRAMKIVYSKTELENFMNLAIKVSPDRPILIDKFLEDAIEVDVDAISDGDTTIIGGIMEHIEEAGVHSGDSASVLPPYSLKPAIIKEISEATYSMAKELKVIGLINIQFAVKDDKLFVLEVNPRASRTVPFVSKATGVPIAAVAAKVMTGMTLEQAGLKQIKTPLHISVKEAVFPFNRFPDADILLGPEMKSTGEVMGIDEDFGLAYAKAQIGAGQQLPVTGTVFISVKEKDRKAILESVRILKKAGFKITATEGTAEFLKSYGIKAAKIKKVSLGRPNIVDAIKNSEIQLIINTGSGGSTSLDGQKIRKSAIQYNIPYTTTIPGAIAVCRGIIALKEKKMSVKTVQEYNIASLK